MKRDVMYKECCFKMQRSYYKNSALKPNIFSQKYIQAFG